MVDLARLEQTALLQRAFLKERPVPCLIIIELGGVCLIKSEPILSKIPTDLPLHAPLHSVGRGLKG